MQFQIKGINLAMHTELFQVKFKSNVKLRGYVFSFLQLTLVEEFEIRKTEVPSERDTETY